MAKLTAILFMQIKWSRFIYELLEPQTALECLLFFKEDAFMSNQSTVLSQVYFPNYTF